MSRTKKGSKGCGYDFGAKYNCDKGYSGGIGKTPKDLADIERRNQGKKEISEQLKRINND